jgi:VWFA-related protein
MKLLAVIASLLMGPALLAQAPDSAPPQESTLSVRSSLVLVPAMVKTKGGDVVFTLTSDDFAVTDDGVEQKLRLEDDTDGQPLALVVCVETGGSGSRRLDQYRDLGPVLDALIGNVPHKVAVVGFDSAPMLLHKFTPDVDAVAGTLGSLDLGDEHATILDAIGFSVDLLRKQPTTYRRAILLISETIDNGSHMKLEEALRAISDTNTAIYSLGFSSGKANAAHYADRELPYHVDGAGNISFSNAHPGPAHGCMGKDPDPDATTNKGGQAFDCLGLLVPPLALAKLAAIRAADAMQRNVPETVAQLTGGEYFQFENSRSLVRGLLTISNHVPNRYVLSFQPHSPHAGYHSVELKLKDHPGLEITARSSYWADTDANSVHQP